jgi:blue light- and temperature-responsive anti-repressor
MFEPLQIRVDLQPIVALGSPMPFAWQADATASGHCFHAVAATLPPEDRPVLEAYRIGRAIEAAAAAGLADGDALLVLPLCSATGTPDRLLAHLFRCALVHRFPTDRIVIDVSADERVNRDRAAALAEACAGRGLMVSLAAFAAGPVALGLLAHFTPRMLRLDPALARRLDASVSRRRIVDGVVRLARGMGVAVVAPGIARRAECDSAIAAGIRHFQGEWAGTALAPRRCGPALAPANARGGAGNLAASPYPQLAG